MRKTDVTQHTLYSYRTLEERIPGAHPLRKLRVLVDGILRSMSADLAPLYSKRGRPSISLRPARSAGRPSSGAGPGTSTSSGNGSIRTSMSPA